MSSRMWPRRSQSHVFNSYFSELAYSSLPGRSGFGVDGSRDAESTHGVRGLGSWSGYSMLGMPAGECHSTATQSPAPWFRLSMQNTGQPGIQSSDAKGKT